MPSAAQSTPDSDAATSVNMPGPIAAHDGSVLIDADNERARRRGKDQRRHKGFRDGIVMGHYDNAGNQTQPILPTNRRLEKPPTSQSDLVAT